MHVRVESTATARLLRSVAAAGLLLGFLSCDSCGSRTAPTRPANDDVARTFGICSATETPPTQLSSVEFRLDDSMSMAGYVSVPSAYRTVLRRVIEGAVQAGYPSTVRGFSSPASVPIQSLGEVMQPHYYAALDTRLAEVLDDIAKPPAKGERSKIVVLVSDLIQDEQSRDALAIAQSLREVSRRFPNIILYGFRSAFRGAYYVSSPPRGKVLINTLDGVGRPFYVLVLAPSAAALKQFEQFAGLYELLNDKTYGGQTFEPSFAPVVVDSAKLRNDPDPAKNEWVAFETPSDWRCGDGAHVQIHSLQSTSSARDGDVRLSFDLHATALLPIITPVRYAADIRRLSANGRAESAGDVTVKTEGDLANPSCTISYRFPAPRHDRWEVYSIRLRAGDANLTRPKWTTDWSTDDDSSENTRDRTLNLAAFADALIRAVSERATFFEQVIEFYRGE
jgi:hypothetical protein